MRLPDNYLNNLMSHLDQYCSITMQNQHQIFKSSNIEIGILKLLYRSGSNAVGSVSYQMDPVLGSTTSHNKPQDLGKLPELPESWAGWTGQMLPHRAAC